ncbi:hypothetical protein IXO599_20040 [Xanthomonas oryzae pv. oryzae]|nr:hypothetical protein IXO599_20040 [Xanthomonas oryzae pv. oryzae]
MSSTLPAPVRGRSRRLARGSLHRPGHVRARAARAGRSAHARRPPIPASWTSTGRRSHREDPGRRRCSRCLRRCARRRSAHALHPRPRRA